MSLDFDQIRRTIDWKMAPEDPMFAGNMDHYSSVGESALKSIIAARLLANVGTPSSILDFACANGRVTRWLRAAYPNSDLHVADINHEWADWSAQTFGATAWYSTSDLRDLARQAPRRFDQIWCGSLATHISPHQTTALIRTFFQWLEPNGVAIITMHGRRFIKNAINRTHAYFPEPLSIEPLLSDMTSTGFGYIPHPGQDHGISAATPEWLIRTIREVGARVVSFSEHAWDNHQDVVAFQRAPI
ncbi:TPA: methyltransferase domain-containing protein [Burkholderia vietnamiensis]|nr:methyltransferase domain-containing protein [Burkholderia vietnamiensis]